jgi:hypothetical protein
MKQSQSQYVRPVSRNVGALTGKTGFASAAHVRCESTP